MNKAWYKLSDLYAFAIVIIGLLFLSLSARIEQFPLGPHSLTGYCPKATMNYRILLLSLLVYWWHPKMLQVGGTVASTSHTPGSGLGLMYDCQSP